jgi:hypothetical protein
MLRATLQNMTRDVNFNNTVFNYDFLCLKEVEKISFSFFLANPWKNVELKNIGIPWWAEPSVSN